MLVQELWIERIVKWAKVSGDCHSGTRRGSLAQMVERSPEKGKGEGSITSRATNGEVSSFRGALGAGVIPRSRHLWYARLLVTRSRAVPSGGKSPISG